MNKPDFKLYADSILDRQELEIALRKIYDVGYRDGYMDLNQEPSDCFLNENGVYITVDDNA